jgi:hypothetical protein
MFDPGTARRWMVLVVRLPAEPARYRMAVWRDLRRGGAVLLGPTVWAVPNLPAVEPLVARVNALVEQADGTVLALVADGRAGGDTARLERLYADARAEEWSEFRADCGKYLAELASEEARQKYTLAELEEEEQSLDRLRRWFRELRGRDLLGSEATTEAATELKRCEAAFDGYAENVYAALAQPHPVSRRAAGRVDEGRI